MKTDWNSEGFLSGITEDYSNYRWYKGEKDNPYTNDKKRPLAASFWYYERDFHFSYLDSIGSNQTLADAYTEWKAGLLKEHLPGNMANPAGDTTNWDKAFETGGIYYNY
ncbi:hypothetical protein FACS189440_16880 [Bacteroidia bacterium]|nr:hypothetical protein FACS189440_16880 [Bacteroidia bacterium]